MPRLMSISDIHMSKTMADLNRKIVGNNSPHAPQSDEHKATVLEKAERKMQAELEMLLQTHGYWKRIEGWIRQEQPPRGWQIHLHEAKKNPKLLDIVLLSLDGRYTEFELKKIGGRYSSDGQRILCEDHGLPVFYSVEDAYTHVIGWEQMD